MIPKGSNAPKGTWAPSCPEISSATDVDVRPTWAGAKAADEARREAMMTGFMVLLSEKVAVVVSESFFFFPFHLARKNLWLQASFKLQAKSTLLFQSITLEEERK